MSFRLKRLDLGATALAELCQSLGYRCLIILEPVNEEEDDAHSIMLFGGPSDTTKDDVIDMGTRGVEQIISNGQTTGERFH